MAAPNVHERGTLCKGERHRFHLCKEAQKKPGQKIDSLDEYTASPTVNPSQTLSHVVHPTANSPSAEEMAVLFEKLNQCEIKAAALSLVGHYSSMSGMLRSIYSYIH